MPTYQYACTECDNAFEIVQAFSDDALTACPECAGKLRKLFNAVGVVFKGSGFYRTDSRSSKSSSDPAVKAPSTPSTETKVSAPSSAPASASTSSNTGPS